MGLMLISAKKQDSVFICAYSDTQPLTRSSRHKRFQFESYQAFQFQVDNESSSSSQLLCLSWLNLLQPLPHVVCRSVRRCAICPFPKPPEHSTRLCKDRKPNGVCLSVVYTSVCFVCVISVYQQQHVVPSDCGRWVTACSNHV